MSNRRRSFLGTRQADALRWSLLVSLGLTPLACGGTAVTTGGGGGATPGSAGATPDGAGAGAGAPPGGGGAGPVGGSGVIGGSDGVSGSSGAPPDGGGGRTNQLPVVCAAPQTEDSQLVKCANGVEHRPQPAACPAPTNTGGGEAGAGGAHGDAMAPLGSTQKCQSNADCTGFHLGYCHIVAGELPSCRSGCQTDSECGANAVCVCDGSVGSGRCVNAKCNVDADCGANSFCAQQIGVCNFPSFACLTQEDECWSNADCEVNTPYCMTSGLTHLACQGSVCGRPFLVAETARLAEVVSRGDWSARGLVLDLQGLSATRRAELAAHWARLGQMEHASIAAFARFNLQLLSLGAPAELVEGCNRALIDETRHARLCFALASQYAGSALGPSKLEVRDCFGDTDLASVMKLVLSEGCIGETVAALEALENSEKASDPVVQRVLQGIARDEQSHAELAFRFMGWALAHSSSELRAEIAREAEMRITAFEHTASELQFVAARAVVRPLVAALFAESDALSARGTAPSPA